MKNILLFIFSFSIIFANAQTSIDQDFFDKTDQFLKANVENGRLDYSNLKKVVILEELITQIAQADLSASDESAIQAFYINAYNLLVIRKITEDYPLQSVQEVSGFFGPQKVTVAQESITLNELEKDKLLGTFEDARFHFVLVCGAVDCPPITDFAYRPETLEVQLEMQTKKALNDPQFIKVKEKNIEFSQIFDWYSKDFGGNKNSIIEYINSYRENPIDKNTKIGYYPYDWSLNEMKTTISTTVNGNNSIRYIVSAAVPKGMTETKLFNNLYTQRTDRNEAGDLTNRASFFTSWLSFVYGLNNRFNVGFDLRYRRVNYSQLPSSALDVLGSSVGENRAAFTNFGPKIRWSPTEKLPNFSVQSAFWFPLKSDAEGSATERYIDWDSYIWWTQLFNDVSLGSNFSLFTELDFLWEDIGSNQLNRVSTPMTGIISYFPHPQVTLYGLAGFSPFLQKDFDYFVQLGLGSKYQVSPLLEFELLYTGFTNSFLLRTDGNAATYNIGIRFNR